jgi:hypothetical protein
MVQSFLMKAAAIASHSPNGMQSLATISTNAYVHESCRYYQSSRTAQLTTSTESLFPQTGYPEKYPYAFFSIEGESNCRWCPESDDSINCGLHRQSPIDLLRNRAVAGHARVKDCPDWHFFAFHRDTCTFNDLRDQFSIERHALQLHIPIRPNGDIDCVNGEGERAFPRLDYSKGFPDWWHMARIDISVPSQHLQEGNRYAAEVTLAHFYEQEHVKNQVCQHEIHHDAALSRVKLKLVNDYRHSWATFPSFCRTMMTQCRGPIWTS